MPSNRQEMRPLTDNEIARLERALGSPIERNYLAYWVSRAIEAFIVLMTIPPPGERRDDLKEIAAQGRNWMERVEQSRSARLLPPVVDVQQLMSLLRAFCHIAESLAQQLDQAVGPGHPRTNVALEAFLDRLIGIAKRAKVLPSTPSRALLSPIESVPGPPFFRFVSEVVEIAIEVIRTSPLPRDHVDKAVAALSKVTDPSLVKVIEGLRGRIGDYREGTMGLIEWDIAEDDERHCPEHSQSREE